MPPMSDVLQKARSRFNSTPTAALGVSANSGVSDMSDIEFRQRLAKLQSMLAIRDAQLMSNPKPFLEDMAERCRDLLKVLEDVEYALSPDSVFDYWDANADKTVLKDPGSIQGEAYIRCNKALAVIRNYRNA